jgi:Chaperone of endosialidase
MLGNLILETCNAPGTAADCQLLGPASGRLPFSFSFGSGAACFYVLADGSQEEWGIGTFHVGSPNTLTRTTVLRNSSGSTARLNFLGTTRVYNEIPAERALYVDNNNAVTIPGTYWGQNMVLSQSGGVILQFIDTAQGTDSKKWDFTTNSGSFYGRVDNDGFTAANNWLAVTRSGNNVGTITLSGTGVTVGNGLTVSGGNGLHVAADAYVGQSLYVSSGSLGQVFHLWGLNSARVIEFTGSPGWNLQFDASPGVNNLQYFNNNATFLFWSQGSTGDFYVHGDIHPNSVSDERVKREVAAFTRGLREIIELKPITYFYNGLGGTIDTGKRRVGLIAQSVRRHFPEMVFETPNPPTDMTNPRTDIVRDPRLPGQLSMDEKPLLFALVNGMRELAELNTALAARVAALEATQAP